MELLIMNFRVNDLKPTYGAQIEFQSRIVNNFFLFTHDIEYIDFVYKGLTPDLINDGTTIKAKLERSPARGDYKIYTNADGSLFLKKFFLDNLGLTLEKNIKDFFTIKKLSDKKYEISVIPVNSEVGRFFSSQNLSSQIIEVENNQSNIQLIDKPHNRIIFGAPGTGKSNKLKEQAKQYFSNTVSQGKEEFLEELSNALNGDSKGSSVCTLGIKYANYIPFGCDSVNALVKEVVEDKGKDVINISTQLGYGIKCAQNLNLNYSLDDQQLFERVTFHPNYSYAQFVGTYKPVMKTVGDMEEISYEYVPGPFIRTYIKAKKTDQNVLLLIEEINRANVAAVFGDVFQLLDRDENGNSEYPITTSEDLRIYLAKPENLGGSSDDYKTLSIPSNMYIWATMNSADQGVFPMDTAFKRRWEFEYIDIDNNEDQIEDCEIPVGNNKKVKWNKLRKAINSRLIELGINEDKLLGPFFLNKSVLESAMTDDTFVKKFESKVLMYLFEDAAKMKAKKLFKLEENKFIYSELCKKFERQGLDIFEGVSVDVTDIPKKEDDSVPDGALFQE